MLGALTQANFSYNSWPHSNNLTHLLLSYMAQKDSVYQNSSTDFANIH